MVVLKIVINELHNQDILRKYETQISLNITIVSICKKQIPLSDKIPTFAESKIER